MNTENPHDPEREARDVIPGTTVHINGIPLFTVGIATLSTHSKNWPLTGATCIERNIAPQPESPGSTPTPDSTIEQEIQAKGLTAPRVTPADIEANIASEHYFLAEDGLVGATLRANINTLNVDSSAALRLLTFCVLTLKNGFTVTGESACASPENFDAELGRKIARQNAVQKMWPLMGYALKERLAYPQNVQQFRAGDPERHIGD